jgi:hypothetical protein
MATHTVKQSGGDFNSLNTALQDVGTGAGDTISIEGTWTIDDIAAATVSDANITITCDSDSRNPGYAHSGSGTWYRHRRSGSGHSLTIDADNLLMEKIDIQNPSTGASDEIFRISTTITTFAAKRCVFGFDTVNSQQDAIHSTLHSSQTFNIENTVFYNVQRAVFDLYSNSNNTITVNLNSCHFYNVAPLSSEYRHGVVGIGPDTNTTYDIYMFNCCVELGDSTSYIVNSISTSGTVNVTIDRSIQSNASGYWSLNADSETVTDSLVSHNWTDDNSKSSDGDWVIVEDITTSPYDMRLQSNDYNEAQDMHADGSGAGLTMPSIDIVGTSRPQNTNYDVGAFEIAVAVVEKVPTFLTAQTLINPRILEV